MLLDKQLSRRPRPVETIRYVETASPTPPHSSITVLAPDHGPSPKSRRRSTQVQKIEQTGALVQQHYYFICTDTQVSMAVQSSELPLEREKVTMSPAKRSSTAATKSSGSKSFPAVARYFCKVRIGFAFARMMFNMSWPETQSQIPRGRVRENNDSLYMLLYML